MNFDKISEKSTEHSPEDYGKNIKLKLTFMRHEQPGKTPEGMSADFLTEHGKESAVIRGQELEQGIKKLYSSPKKRAKQTVDIMGQNAAPDIDVINKTFEETGKEQPEGEKENKFIVRELPELDTISNIATLWKEATVKAKEAIANGDKHREIDLQLQYILDNPNRVKELGAPSVEEIAAPLAYRIAQEAKISSKLLNNSEAELIHGTHGPKLEPLLKEILVNEKGEKGFKHVDEIGGAFDPGEGFSVNLERANKIDTEDSLNIKLLIRNKEYNIDKTRLLELAQSYVKSKETVKS